MLGFTNSVDSVIRKANRKINKAELELVDNLKECVKVCDQETRLINTAKKKLNEELDKHNADKARAKVCLKEHGIDV